MFLFLNIPVKEN